MEISWNFAFKVLEALKSQEALLKEIQTDVKTTNCAVNALNLEVKDIRKEINSKRFNSKTSAKSVWAKNTINKSVLFQNKNQETSKRKIQQKESKKQKIIKVEKSETTVSNVQGESSNISAVSNSDGGGPIISEECKDTMKSIKQNFEKNQSNSPSNKPPIPPPPYSAEIISDRKLNIKHLHTISHNPPQNPRNIAEHKGSKSKIVTVSSSTTKVSSCAENSNNFVFSSQKTDLSENESIGETFPTFDASVGNSNIQNVSPSTNSGFNQPAGLTLSNFAKETILDSSKPSSSSYRCPQCGKSYKIAKYFENHLKMHWKKEM